MTKNQESGNDPMSVEEFVDHIQNCLGPVDAAIVAQEGQIDAPEGWVLKGTEVIGGKRIRLYEIGESHD
jgi:hypothetical protein